jgi:hypothetical protein
MTLSPRQLNHFRAAHRKLSELGHKSPEAFALAKPASGPKRGNYISVERILFEILDLVRRELAADNIHVGYTVLELAIFQTILNCPDDPVDEIASSIRAQRLHEPGFLIFPLLGLGLLAPSTASLMQLGGPHELIDPSSGIAVTSQLSSEQSLVDFLTRAAASLGIIGQVGARDISHYCSMVGVTDWLIRNPLLIVRVRSITMGPWENQAAYNSLIAHRLALLGMISAQLEPRHQSRLLSHSTNTINNSETRNIRHYFVFETTGDPTKSLKSERVPIGLYGPQLLQLADLPIDIDPAAWQDPSARTTINALTDAMIDLEELQASAASGQAIGVAKANVRRKISTSLHWFRRSFAASADPREAVVAMAVAFEALLSDGYSRGITNRIVDRAKECLKGQPNFDQLIKSISTLFAQRGAIVHRGELQEDINLRECRIAYSQCFSELVRRATSYTSQDTLTIQVLFDSIQVSPFLKIWRKIKATWRAIFGW